MKLTQGEIFFIFESEHFLRVQILAFGNNGHCKNICFTNQIEIHESNQIHEYFLNFYFLKVLVVSFVKFFIFLVKKMSYGCEHNF